MVGRNVLKSGYRIVHHVPVPAQGNCHWKDTHDEEDSRWGGWEPSHYFLADLEKKKRVRVLAMFSKERLADFILYSNFPHVFLITRYAYYYIFVVFLTGEKATRY